ncbi:MAG: hypothetical protein AAFR66_24420 [Bacteroidota bacterium]
MKLGRASFLGIILCLVLGMGCQTDSYSSASKEGLKDSIRTADSLNAIRMGDSIREIKVEVKEQLRLADSSQVELSN